MIVFLILACKAPIEAPKDFEEVLAYIYLHTMDEEIEALEAGLINLEKFASNHREELLEGYTIAPLQSESIESTGTQAKYIDEQYGVSRLYHVPYPTKDLVYCNTVVDLESVYVDDYLEYDRTYLSDLDCFLDRSCDTLSFRSTILTELPLNAEMTSNYINELRWVELESGLTVVQRSWMDGEAESTADWVSMLAQYYIGITYTASGGSDTVAASWAALMLGDIPLPEDTAKNQALDALERNGEDLTNYLDEHGSGY